jgi:apolipoprotein N-acyltransferase
VGWLALAPLLIALRGAGLRRGFLLGLLSGVIYFTGTLYWITHVMVVYGGLAGWVGVAVNALLILFLSLYPAIFALVVSRIQVAHRELALALSPLVWVATELGRTHIFSGFPWVLLGYSQTSMPPIAQLASVVGVYGVSLLVASVSAALAIAFDRRTVRGRIMPLAAVLPAVVLVAAWGSWRISRGELTREGTPVRVGMIQGNVDQAIKWDPARASEIFQDYIRKSREAIVQGATLLLWPESSTPFLFEEDAAAAETVRTLARQARVPILFGSDQVEWRIEGNRRIPEKFYNSAFLVRADGTTAGVYRKMHLVPFGEYIPLQKLLFFAAPLTEQVGTFTPGATAELLPVDGHPVSVAICYEVVYPSLVRQFVTGGSELLTTITNDAWFGRTSAPYQHFEQAAMRAIENGRYLVRAANTGISGIVDPYGRVVQRTGIYEPAVVVGDARFLTTTTLYARIGDAVAYVSVVVTLAAVVLSRRRVQ